ncbi:MAG TPA: hypothetical protein VJI73_03640, partial [Candidatus Paceibacterota bacterium]
GFVPFTEAELPLQIGIIKANRESLIVAPHYHKPTKRVTGGLGECLVVIKGKINIQLFNTDKKVIRNLSIKAREGFVLYSGGHALNFTKGTEAFEFKNGPFVVDRINLN